LDSQAWRKRKPLLVFNFQKDPPRALAFFVLLYFDFPGSKQLAVFYLSCIYGWCFELERKRERERKGKRESRACLQGKRRELNRLKNRKDISNVVGGQMDGVSSRFLLRL
jgi:hypothetical protein